MCGLSFEHCRPSKNGRSRCVCELSIVFVRKRVMQPLLLAAGDSFASWLVKEILVLPVDQRLSSIAYALKNERVADLDQQNLLSRLHFLTEQELIKNLLFQELKDILVKIDRAPLVVPSPKPSNAIMQLLSEMRQVVDSVAFDLLHDTDLHVLIICMFCRKLNKLLNK